MPRPFLDRRNIKRTAIVPPRINFKLMGNWEEVVRQINRLGPEVKKSSLGAQMKVATVIATKVKRHIRDQDLPWAPLHDDYQRKKQQKGLSGKTLMAYKTYYENIEVWKVGNQHLLNIGVKRGIYTHELSGRKSKIDVATIAAIHEFSSGKKLPRRPLWNPSIGELGGAKGLKKLYVNSLVWRLRKAGLKVTTKQGLFSSSFTIGETKIRL